MQTVIQLEDRVDRDDLIYRQSGNVLLNSISGSRVIYYPHGEDENGADAALFAEATRLRKQGKTPYVIPLGMQKPPTRGTWLYTLCGRVTVSGTRVRLCSCRFWKWLDTSWARCWI